eukprot:TRINITY_DN51268_c0_g1_i1.p1 TRINITY_DN51268_c0_g1~~TRINITY_DN51268_c0_g1_i1.p1  ORF type:complete len:543 (+),score=83.40 TRINITY_DN51268_c0_g1_i1:54-1682(+)
MLPLRPAVFIVAVHVVCICGSGAKLDCGEYSAMATYDSRAKYCEGANNNFCPWSGQGMIQGTSASMWLKACFPNATISFEDADLSQCSNRVATCPPEVENRFGADAFTVTSVSKAVNQCCGEWGDQYFISLNSAKGSFGAIILKGQCDCGATAETTTAAATGGGDTPLVVLPGTFEMVTALAFSPDGMTLGSAEGYQGSLSFWNFDSGNLLRRFDEVKAYAVVLNPSGTMFATASKSDASIWDLGSFDVLHVIGLDKHGLEEGVSAVAFSPDGLMLAVGGMNHDTDPVTLFDVKTGTAIRSIGMSEGWVRPSLTFNPTGTMLAVERINKIVIYDVATGALVQNFDQHHRGAAGSNMAFSPDWKYLASGGGASGNTVRLYDVQTGVEIRSMIHSTMEDHMGYVQAIAFSPDGKTLASGGRNKIIKLWNMADGKVLRSIATDKELVVCLAFSPDGSKLVSGEDGSIKIWSIADSRDSGAKGSADDESTSTTQNVVSSTSSNSTGDTNDGSAGEGSQSTASPAVNKARSMLPFVPALFTLFALCM